MTKAWIKTSTEFLVRNLRILQISSEWEICWTRYLLSLLFLIESDSRGDRPHVRGSTVDSGREGTGRPLRDRSAWGAGGPTDCHQQWLGGTQLSGRAAPHRAAQVQAESERVWKSCGPDELLAWGDWTGDQRDKNTRESAGAGREEDWCESFVVLLFLKIVVMLKPTSSFQQAARRLLWRLSRACHTDFRPLPVFCQFNLHVFRFLYGACVHQNLDRRTPVWLLDHVLAFNELKC